jgi:hypothetical protein
MSIASNKKYVHSSLSVRGNNNNVLQWLNGSDSDLNSEGLKTANTILRDGSDLLGAPSRWVKDMQQNWFAYILITAIILICILFLYCIIRYHCSRQKKGLLDTSRLTELATIMASIKPTSLTSPSAMQTNQV